MKKISVVTLGCKVNQYDTAVLLNQLPKNKYIKNKKYNDRADIYIIDTCTVTHKADSEARNYIYRAKRSNPDAVVVVTGCYAQVSPDDLNQIEGVDYIIGNSHKTSSLLKVIREAVPQNKPKIYISDIFKEKNRKFDTPDINYFPDRTRAFLKVQDGCNYACTFCIIPRARGRSRSLAVDEIISRIINLKSHGYKEVVLTGIHLASYGRDIGTDFQNLLKQLEKEKIINRIRLSSLDPADIGEDIINFCADSEVICPSFHIALQSGDENILKKMRRRYKPKDFINCTDYIRKKIPSASIGTDVMVGFPSESDQYFKNTYNLVKESELTYFHVFPYSIRKNTSAAVMEEHVEPEIKKERSRKLRELGSRKKIEFYKNFIGKELNTLVESKSRGTTDNYINVKFMSDKYNIGDEVIVKIKNIVGEQAVSI
ncbi:MAG: tRNA (N(6)-L-threonylcarbamoyladenosine(37)-C(2))-methylthiotransferase MtaB [Thermodesulfobacteriota bacterium]